MTYLECYETVVNRLKDASYPLHEVYSQALARPCIVVEAHPQKSDVLNATGKMNSMEFVVTFMPILDERNNIKDQRDMMRFVDETLSLFRGRIPGVVVEASPAGNAVTECYVKLTAQFADTMIEMEDAPLIKDIVMMTQIE